MDKDWVSIFSSTELHTVEFAKQVLEQENIASIVLNNQDSFYKIGEIYLYVKKENVIPAKRIIDNFQQ
jgi:hypothetical protein